MQRRHGLEILAVATAAFWVALPAPSQAQQTASIVAFLDGGQETPPIATAAHGRMTLTVNRDAAQVTYTLDIYNLPTGITGAHIHAGCSGVAGPVVLGIPIRRGESGTFRLSGVLGAAEFTPRPANGVNVIDNIIVAIMAGTAYVNVHSDANPAGEIRAQLRVERPSDNPANGILVPCR